MPFRFLAGEKFNLLSRGTVTVDDTDSLFPLAGLSDGYADLPWKNATLRTNGLVTLDSNLVLNGGFETALLASWTEASTGSGTSAAEAGIFNGGAGSMKLGGGASGVGSRYQDISVRSGERLNLTFALRGDGVGYARIRVQNRATGNYLRSDGTWQAAIVELAAQQPAAWVVGVGGLGATFPFQIENSFNQVLGSLVTLRVTCLTPENAFAYFDDVYLWPAWNWVSVHGHNLDQIVPEIHSSTDNFVAADTLEATLAVKQPSFYGIIADSQRRYARLKLTGTNSAIAGIGEVVVGYAETLLRGMDRGWTLDWIDDNVVARGPTGKRFSTVRTQSSRRALKLPFTHVNQAQFIQVRDEIYRRSRGEGYPLVVAPRFNTGDETDPCILGFLAGSSWTVARPELNEWTDALMIEESPFPTFTP